MRSNINVTPHDRTTTLSGGAMPKYVHTFRYKDPKKNSTCCHSSVSCWSLGNIRPYLLRSNWCISITKHYAPVVRLPHISVSNGNKVVSKMAEFEFDFTIFTVAFS